MMPPKEVICPSCGCPMKLVDDSTMRRKSRWSCHYCHHETPLNSDLKPFQRDFDQERAEQYLKICDWQEANDAFTKVLDKYAWSANAWIGKGIAAIGLGLDYVRDGNNTKAKQYFVKAEQYLATPRKTPCNFFTYKEYIALPCRLEFYQLLVSRFTSTSISGDEISHLIKTLFGFCDFQPIVYYANAWNQNLCSFLLPMGEFYYSLVKWIKPEIEDNSIYFEDLETALNHIIFLAQGSDPKSSDQYDETLQYEGISPYWASPHWLGNVVNEKTIYYSGVSTNQQLNLERLVDKWWWSYKWSGIHDFVAQKPTVVEQPDENTTILRARIKIKVHELADVKKNTWKDYWRDYVKDFTFCREANGKWICETDISLKNESIEEIDELTKNWERLPDTSE